MVTSKDFFPDNFDPKSASDEAIAQIFQKLQLGVDNQVMEAVVILGYWYEIGFGADQCEEKAIELYQLATHLNSRCAPYNLAMIYLRSGRIDPALQFLEIAVARGATEAMVKLGSFYESGVHVKKNLKLAVSLYQLGAKTKNTDSVFRLVSCYRRGLTDKISFSEAKKMVESILNDDDDQGWYEMGLLVSSERNDDPLAPSNGFGFFEKAADLGCEASLAFCGEAYSMGLDRDRDLEKGIRYLEKAILQGNTRARYVMAVLHSDDEGALPDITRAFNLCQQSAYEGEVNAMKMLGLMYLRGHGVGRDQQIGEAWLRKAADDGHLNTPMKIGEL